MDYFSVIVLLTIIFVFITDRKIKTIDVIKKENNKINKQIKNIKEKLEIIKLDPKDMNLSNLLIINKKLKSKYILIQNSQINLKDSDMDVIIANYINTGKKPCGFKLLYSYRGKKWSLKKIYIDIINYLNIFNKKEISTYGLLIYKSSDNINKRMFKKKLISYTGAEFANIIFADNQIEKDGLKKIYINKLSNADMSLTFKILLLIFSGSIITTNLISSILNIQESVNNLIIALVIYYCYSYIIRYVYTPIGSKKIFASYIFPIYFIAYVVVSIYTFVLKVIKNVQAS